MLSGVAFDFTTRTSIYLIHIPVAKGEKEAQADLGWQHTFSFVRLCGAGLPYIIIVLGGKQIHGWQADGIGRGFSTGIYTQTLASEKSSYALCALITADG